MQRFRFLSAIAVLQTGLVSAPGSDAPAPAPPAIAPGAWAKVRPPLPEGVTVQRDLPYLGPDRAEKADFYLPLRKDPSLRSPAVVVVHGGGWSGGDKDSAREWNICGTLASHGYAALSINYLLNDKAHHVRVWPRNLHDCKSAVRWLRKNADHYGLDPAHIGAIGGSAGGHLVSMLAVTGPDSGLEPSAPYGDESARIQCVIDLYGPLVCDSTGPVKPTDDLRKSPLGHLDANDPPFLILHGTADTTVDVARSREFAAALAQAGVPHELVIVENAVHTFHLQPPQRDLRPLVLGFFDQHLKPRP